MDHTPREVVIAYLLLSAFWGGLVLVVLIGARRSSRLSHFRQQMLAQWKPALAIALVTWISIALSGRGLLNLSFLAVFCQVLVALALARGRGSFEPLPVSQSILCRERTCILKIAGMIVTAILIIVPTLIAGSIGTSIGQQVFHEVNYTREAQTSLS